MHKKVMETTLTSVHNYTKFGTQEQNDTFNITKNKEPAKNGLGAVGDFVLVIDDTTKKGQTVYVHDNITVGGIHLQTAYEVHKQIQLYNSDWVIGHYFSRTGNYPKVKITQTNGNSNIEIENNYGKNSGIEGGTVDDSITTNVEIGVEKVRDCGTTKPSNPLKGDYYTSNNHTYIYDGTNWHEYPLWLKVHGDTVLASGNTVIDANGNINAGTSSKPVNVTVVGNETIKKDGNGENGNLTVEGNETVAGDSTVNGDSTVKGNETVDGTIKVLLNEETNKYKYVFDGNGIKVSDENGNNGVTINNYTVNNTSFLGSDSEPVLPTSNTYKPDPSLSSTDAQALIDAANSALLTLGWLRKVLTNNNGDGVNGDNLLDGIFIDDAQSFSNWIFSKEETFVKEMANAVVSNETINNAIGNAISTAIDKDVTIANKLKASLDIPIPLTGKDIEYYHYKKKYENEDSFRTQANNLKTKKSNWDTWSSNPENKAEWERINNKLMSGQQLTTDEKKIYNKALTNDEKKVLSEWEAYQNMLDSEKSDFLKFTYIQDDEESIFIKKDYIWFVCGGENVDNTNPRNIIGDDNPTYQKLIDLGLLNPKTLPDKIKNNLNQKASEAYLVSCNWGKTPRTAFKTINRATKFISQHFQFNDQTARLLIKENTKKIIENNEEKIVTAEYKSDRIDIGGLNTTNGALRIEPLSFVTTNYDKDNIKDSTIVAKIYDTYNIRKDGNVEITRIDKTKKYIPLIEFCGVEFEIPTTEPNEPSLNQGLLTLKSDVITKEEYDKAIKIGGSAGLSYRSTQADIYKRRYNVQYLKVTDTSYRKRYWLYDDAVIHRTTNGSGSNQHTIILQRSIYQLYNLSIKITFLPKEDHTVTPWIRILQVTNSGTVNSRCCEYEMIVDTHEYGRLPTSDNKVTQEYVMEMIISDFGSRIEFTFYNAFKITHKNSASYIDLLAMQQAISKSKKDVNNWLTEYNRGREEQDKYTIDDISIDYESGIEKLPNDEAFGVIYQDTPNTKVFTCGSSSTIIFANNATSPHTRHMYISGEFRYIMTVSGGGNIQQTYDGRYKIIFRVPENEKLYVDQMYYIASGGMIRMGTWCDLQGVKDETGKWVRCFQDWGKTFPDVHSRVLVAKVDEEGYLIDSDGNRLLDSEDQPTKDVKSVVNPEQVVYETVEVKNLTAPAYQQLPADKIYFEDNPDPITDCALPGRQKYIDLFGNDYIWKSSDISLTNPYNNNNGADVFGTYLGLVEGMYTNYEPMLSYSKITDFIKRGIS